MNINHLRYFEEVCRQGGVTKAAENCHISQPSITAAINGLEKELGCQLFSHVNNRLHLTEQGRQFRHLTENFLKQFNDYYEKACDLSHNRIATVRLGVPSVMGTFFFEKIIPDFYVKHPDVHLEIYEIATIDGIDMLHNAQLDLLLGINSESSYASCDSKPIFKTELRLAINRKHPLSQEQVITDEMLAELPLVVISKGSYHYQVIQQTFSGVNLNVIMHSSQLSTIKYMVENNYAAAIIYKDVFSRNRHIRCVPFQKPLDAHVHVFWQKSNYLSAAMRRFIAYITRLDI